VPAGGTATATWQVTPAAGATPQEYPITFGATSSEGTFSSLAQANVPYASVATAYDNTGISDDNAPAAGAFDGGGLNFSAQALAADGFVSGQTVTVDGTSFTWPGVNVPDSIVCGGQAVPVSGSGSTLAFLGASNNGTGSGTATIVYTDGTTQSIALGFADWWSGIAIAGTSIAATTPYLNNGPNSSRQTQPVNVYDRPVEDGAVRGPAGCHAERRDGPGHSLARLRHRHQRLAAPRFPGSPSLGSPSLESPPLGS
jgi:beta-glucosidase